VLAFLSDCKENPTDDTPRLILADWLDENGDERGEFVRLQCQRAGRGDVQPSAEVGGRETELLERHRAAWLGVLGEKGIRTEMERGLVRAAGSHGKLLTKRLAGLRDYEPTAWVDSLHIYDSSADDLPKLAASPHWTCLSRLDLRKYVYYADHLMDPATVGNSRGDWSALPDLAVLAGLTELGFSCQDLGVSGATVLATVPDLKRLRILDVSSNNLGDRGVAALVASRALTGLTRLSLTQNRLRAEGFATLAGWPGLATVTELSLTHNYPGDAGVAALADSPWLGNLRELWLNAESIYFIVEEFGDARRLGPLQIGPAGAVALAKAKSLARLRRLNLAENRIGPEGAEALAASTALPALTELDIAGNHIGDAGAIAIANSPTLAGLTSLTLRHNGIRDRGAEALASSPYLTRLTEFNFQANRETTTSRGLDLLCARFGAVVHV
jgi:uncharacterized protein (TIGR02996 family)